MSGCLCSLWVLCIMEHGIAVLRHASLPVQVQRLQRHATYGHFKQLVLQLIADDVIDIGHDPSQAFAQLRCAAV